MASQEMEAVIQQFLSTLGQAKNKKANTESSKESDTMVSKASIGKAPERFNNEQDAVRAAVLENLQKLGELTVKDDSIQFDGDKIVLPKRFDGDLLGAASFLEQIHEAEETEFSFGRTFKYRPWDGAAAFQRALYSTFGTTGLGKATQSFFGSRPPQLVSVAVGHGKNIQVPWGEVNMPALDGTFTLGGAMDQEYGLLFRLNVTAPRKYRAKLEAFFDIVQGELEERSIYRGNAFNGAEEPEFLDLSWVNEDKVVYSEEVSAQLDANIWSLIKYTDEMKALNIPMKRAVLLEGPFGTGKSLAGALTAKLAKENGWTFILARPGKDDLFEVLNTAKLYAPAVVQFEDIDTIAKGGSDQQISSLLDALDGIGNKGNGVVAMFTTNYVEKIQKAVMRPGRIDSIIHIGHLDRKGVEKLIKSVVDPSILGEIDYDVVYAQTEKFLPAFVTEAVNRATRYALSRNGGKRAPIGTEDIVNAAIGLQRQLELMDAAKEGADQAPTLDSAFKGIARTAAEEAARSIVNGTKLYDNYGDVEGKLRTNG
jgi:ATPase family protein associated with various cellular activities (AAA)